MGRYLSGNGPLPQGDTEKGMSCIHIWYKHMNRLRLERILICLLLVLWMNGCWKEETHPLQATIALVNDVPITVEELLAVFPKEEEAVSDNGETMQGERRSLHRALLEQLIEKEMLLQEASRLKIHPTDLELGEKMEGLKDGMDEAAFSQLLIDQKVSRKDLEEATKNNLSIEKLLNQLFNEHSQETLRIPEEAVREYYDTNQEKWRVDEELKLRQIVVETEEEAEALRLSILNGADFLKSAVMHSQPSHIGDGGDLGYLERAETPIGFDSLFQTKVGEISQVIKTQFGYHIVKVEDRRPARIRSYEDVREKITQVLIEKKREALFGEWLKKLRQRTEVLINEELFKKYS